MTCDRHKIGVLFTASFAAAAAGGCAGEGGLAPFAELRAQSALERGQDRLADNDLDAALAAFERAIQLNPDLAAAHSRIGSIWRCSLQRTPGSARSGGARGSLKLRPGRLPPP